jgi:8-oxo-dGTP pyrophosphatase MutT (NUDIX family)
MPTDYIKQIRKIIGHDPLLGVGLGVLIFNEKEEILLEKRTDNGLYCLVGGGVDLGEKVVEGAKREIKEETGLDIEELHFMGVKSGEEQKLLYPNGDLTYYVDFYFHCHIDSSKQTPKISDGESTELRFYPLDQLPPDEKLLRGTKEPIEYYLSGKKEPFID